MKHQALFSLKVKIVSSTAILLGCLRVKVYPFTHFKLLSRDIWDKGILVELFMKSGIFSFGVSNKGYTQI